MTDSTGYIPTAPNARLAELRALIDAPSGIVNVFRGTIEEYKEMMRLDGRLVNGVVHHV